jgi:hypothetical protein
MARDAIVTIYTHEKLTNYLIGSTQHFFSTMHFPPLVHIAKSHVTVLRDNRAEVWSSLVVLLHSPFFLHISTGAIRQCSIDASGHDRTVQRSQYNQMCRGTYQELITLHH